MNIFILDNDPVKAAQYHVNKHVVKMITETAQMLSTTLYFTEQSDLAPYRKTHINHPCTVWCRESLSNWKWLRDFGLALYDEYMFRYGNKTHKAGNVILRLTEPNLIDIGLTKFPQAIPDQYRDIDTVKAYRRYYIGDKQHLFNWGVRGTPMWIVQKK